MEKVSRERAGGISEIFLRREFGEFGGERRAANSWPKFMDPRRSLGRASLLGERYNYDAERCGRGDGGGTQGWSVLLSHSLIASRGCESGSG